jgi:poly-gamma-glutamate synthase PgsB/CapB
MRIVGSAARENANALVIECMALDPTLQQVCEHSMVHATIGVITNARPDHLEVMGETLDSVAETLSQTIPAAGVLITGSGPAEERFRESARLRGTSVCRAGVEALPSGLCRDDPILSENLALVRSIGINAGISASKVDDILKHLGTKAESREIRTLGNGDQRKVLVDAFSINDTVSAENFQRWALARNRNGLPRPWVALLNTRSDRPMRTREFCRFLSLQSVYDVVGLAGGGRRLARWYLRPQAVRTPVFMLPDTNPTAVLQSIGKRTGGAGFTIVGLGNHRGIGETLRGHFDEAAACF